jgi:hypothetical protein
MPLDTCKFAVELFGITPDQAILFFSSTPREALGSKVHGLRSGRGFTAQWEKE